MSTNTHKKHLYSTHKQAKCSKEIKKMSLTYNKKENENENKNKLQCTPFNLISCILDTQLKVPFAVCLQSIQRSQPKKTRMLIALCLFNFTIYTMQSFQISISIFFILILFICSLVLLTGCFLNTKYLFIQVNSEKIK